MRKSNWTLWNHQPVINSGPTFNRGISRQNIIYMYIYPWSKNVLYNSLQLVWNMKTYFLRLMSLSIYLNENDGSSDPSKNNHKNAERKSVSRTHQKKNNYYDSSPVPWLVKMIRPSGYFLSHIRGGLVGWVSSPAFLSGLLSKINNGVMWGHMKQESVNKP